jgi:tetratricopeptide (TPR) repeat protein
MKLGLRVLFLCALWTSVSSTPIGAQGNPLAALQAQDGWNALAAGHADTAAKIFQQAIAIDPNNPELYLGAGTAAFIDRRDDVAQAALERAVQLDPALARARELLGLVQYRRGDLFGAIRTYESLDRSQAHNQQAVERLERWRRELDLHNRMDTIVGSAFTVSFEGERDADLAARVLESLERATSRISSVLSYPLRPVPVVLYTGQQFHDITRSPSWAAGAYDGTIRIPIRGALSTPGELDRVIAHEFTHAVIHGLAPRGVPTWLNEGLATVLEREGADAVPDDPGRSIPQPRLGSLRASFGPMSPAEAKVAYATSARAVRWLIENAGSFAVVNLLRDVNDGVTFERAFMNRIQRSVASFESELTTPR